VWEQQFISIFVIRGSYSDGLADVTKSHTLLLAVDMAAVAFHASTAPNVTFKCSLSPPLRWLTHVFILSTYTSSESPIVHADAELAFDVLVYAKTLLRGWVDFPKQFTWTIESYCEKSNVKRPQNRPDFFEYRTWWKRPRCLVCGISGKVQSLAKSFNRPWTPQSLAGIERRTARGMLRRSTGQADLPNTFDRHVAAVPPIQLGDLLILAIDVLLEPTLDPQTNEEVDSSLTLLLQLSDSVVVQVVVMVVRYAYDIHLGQLV
jgi:hypothetical protein